MGKSLAEFPAMPGRVERAMHVVFNNEPPLRKLHQNCSRGKNTRKEQPVKQSLSHTVLVPVGFLADRAMKSYFEGGINHDRTIPEVAGGIGRKAGNRQGYQIVSGVLKDDRRFDQVVVVEDRITQISGLVKWKS